MKDALSGLVLLALMGGGCGKGDAPGPMHGGDAGTMMGGGGQHMDMGAMGTMMMQHLGPADSGYDARFIAMMIPHHEGAVMMAKDALVHATRPELKELAKSVITSQEQEIATMKQWQSAWAGGTDNGMMGKPMMDKMSGMGRDMTAMLRPADADYEGRFIDAMIPHHQSALAMANDALGKATRPELKEFARSIIASQQIEIERMSNWRKLWAKR